MIKTKIENVCLQDKFKGHHKIKDNLIKKILSENKVDRLTEGKKKFENILPMSINRSDWNNSENQDREWVKYFAPYLRINFDDMLSELGIDSNYRIDRLWFQHYIKSDIHDWHIHGGNYTGVYYVKFDGVNKTQLINQFDNSLIDIEAEEGDIIIFPSNVIHRFPRVTNEKIIVSFNLDIVNFTKEYVKFMKESFGND